MKEIIVINEICANIYIPFILSEIKKSLCKKNQYNSRWRDPVEILVDDLDESIVYRTHLLETSSSIRECTKVHFLFSTVKTPLKDAALRVAKKAVTSQKIYLHKL